MEQNPYQSPDFPAPEDAGEEKHLVPSLASTWDVSLVSAIVTSCLMSLFSFPLGIVCYLLYQLIVKGSPNENFWTGAFETGQRFLPYGFLLGLFLGWFTPWLMSMTVRVTRRHARLLRKRGTNPVQ